MSVSSLVDLAVARGGDSPPKKVRRYTAKDDTPEAAAEPAGIGVLTSLIPVEVITLYTAFAAIAITRTTPSSAFLDGYKADHNGVAFPYQQTRDFAELRIGVAIFIAACTVAAVYFGWRQGKKENDKRTAPATEIVGAVIAFAAWTLVMPGGLMTPYIKNDDLAIWTGAVLVCSATALIGLGIGVLKNRVSKTG